eukprot:gene15333-biopygen13086
MFNLSTVPVPDLTGRTILVTGAGKGIGAELVRILSGRGARVYAGVHAADRIEEQPGGVTVLALDVTSQTDVNAAIDRIGAETGRLDALVNNAGTISAIAPLAELSTEALGRAFAVNVLGVHRVTVAALPLLRIARGRIVNAGTGAATTPSHRPAPGWAAAPSMRAAAALLSKIRPSPFSTTRPLVTALNTDAMRRLELRRAWSARRRNAVAACGVKQSSPGSTL